MVIVMDSVALEYVCVCVGFGLDCGKTEMSEFEIACLFFDCACMRAGVDDGIVWFYVNVFVCELETTA